jgi:hypothetical protein
LAEIIRRVLEALHRQENTATVAVETRIFRVRLDRLREGSKRSLKVAALRELNAALCVRRSAAAARAALFFSCAATGPICAMTINATAANMITGFFAI